MKTVSLAFAAMFIAGAAFAEAHNVVINTGDTEAGTVLTDGDGMTLYVFDNDTPGVSNCNGDCAVNWPPLAAAEGATPQDKFGIITRADGSRQWAYDGAPLYLWINDSAPGDITGDGVRGIWHLARP